MGSEWVVAVCPKKPPAFDTKMSALFPVHFICEVRNQAEGFTWRLSPRVAASSQTPPTAEIQYIASRAVLSQPVAMANKDARIIVVGGAGTMGSSTALHLARRGYTDVRVLDMFQPPSANSAGNDMNKVCIVA